MQLHVTPTSSVCVTKGTLVPYATSVGNQDNEPFFLNFIGVNLYQRADNNLLHTNFYQRAI